MGATRNYAVSMNISIHDSELFKAPDFQAETNMTLKINHNVDDHYSSSPERSLIYSGEHLSLSLSCFELAWNLDTEILMEVYY